MVLVDVQDVIMADVARVLQALWGQEGAQALQVLEDTKAPQVHKVLLVPRVHKVLWV